MPISTDSALPENRVKISEDLRSMNVPTGEQVLGCVGDAWVRRVWFDMPRYCDGTDLSGYTLSVNYRNTDEDEDRYPVSDAVVNADTITFSWLVGAVACAAPGLTSVSIKAQKLNGDTIEHEFNSTIYYFKVLPANTTGAEPLQEYSDAFTTLMLQWQAEVDTAVAEAPKGKLVGTASGTTAQTVNDAWPTALHGATVYGKSVQDGTPTPDNPVPVQVVGGRNIALPDWAQRFVTAVSSSNVKIAEYDNRECLTYPPNAGYGDYDNKNFSLGNEFLPNTQYTVSFDALKTGATNTAGTVAVYYTDGTNTRVGAFNAVDTWQHFTFTTAANKTVKYFKPDYTSGITYIDLATWQVEQGTHETPYTPYGCIGLQIGETVTPIDLQGHTLAGLPDGTRDELAINAAGVVSITQRVGVVDLGTLIWTYSSNYFRTNGINSLIKRPAGNATPVNAMCTRYAVKPWNSSDNNALLVSAGNDPMLIKDTAYTDVEAFTSAVSGALLYFELLTPQTIELGTITLPELTNPCELAIYASLDPEWAIEYEQDPNMVVTALQSSIAPVEGGTASTNYSVNSYLIHGNQLYRVTSAIATGEAISPGSNCVSCTVMGEVIRLTA